MENKDYAIIFKALGDETRIKILRMLEGTSLCACEILTALNVTQPTLSHHMKVLNQAGIVKTEKIGTWSHYSINTDFIGVVIPFINQLNHFQEPHLCEGDCKKA